MPIKLINFLTLVVFMILKFLVCVLAAPTTSNQFETETINEGHYNPATIPGLSAVVEFLQKYGYLSSNQRNNSQALYSETRLTEGIRLMQKFAGLPQNGLLNNETLSLLKKPRCGVSDVEESGNASADKFSLYKRAWDKRTLSYRLENWSSKLRKEEILRDLEKAMKPWAEHGNLKFLHKPFPYFDEKVDISISFGSGYHGDKYPFDGAGSTLAHAFYPNSDGNLAGDIHFDDDENWICSTCDPKGDSAWNSKISFLAVALHELGHSLGLKHSHVPTSVMFPYYQYPSRQEGNTPELDYDDIMGIYHLYVARPLRGDESLTTPRIPVPTPSTTLRTRPETTFKSFVTPTTTPLPTTPSPNYPSSGKPDLCKGPYDSIAVIRNEIFVFKQQFMWRFRQPGQLLSGNYPVEFFRLFSPLSNVQKIDAAFERDADGKLVIFSGSMYWEYDLDVRTSKGPFSLSSLGLPQEIETIDTAFIWPKNRKTYFFRDDKYWKYDEAKQKIAPGYPKSIKKNWRGIPSHLSSAVSYKDDTYFFKQSNFWKFDDNSIQPDEGFPKSTSQSWFNC